MLSRQDIVTKIHEIRDQVTKWQAADTPLVRWRGGPRKAISNALIDAWNSLFDFVGTLDVADDMKATVLAIDEFEDKHDEWAEKCDLTPEDGDPRGTSGLWTAWSQVLESLTIHRPRTPEPVQTLIAEKVSDRQIGLIYDWVDSNGDVDLDKVRQEKEKPGTHYDPQKWVSKSETKAKAELEEKWKARESRVDARVVAHYTAPEAPETLDELIEQRVPSKQIAELKRINVEDVRRRAAELGIPLDGQFIRRVSPVDRLAEMREDEFDQQADLQRQMQQESGEGQSLPEKVLNLYLDGQTPQEIAETLKADHPKLTYQKVSRIIQDAEQNPATVNTEPQTA